MELNRYYTLTVDKSFFSYHRGLAKNFREYLSQGSINLYTGAIFNLIGLEFSPVSTNFYLYNKALDITVCECDEFMDEYYIELRINYNKIWNKINEL